MEWLKKLWNGLFGNSKEIKQTGNNINVAEVQFIIDNETEVKEEKDTLAEVFKESEDILEDSEEFHDYLKLMRKHRGKLTDMDYKIFAIFMSQEDFSQWMVNTKILGINKAYEYTKKLNHIELASLALWINNQSMRNTKKIEAEVAHILTMRR